MRPRLVQREEPIAAFVHGLDEPRHLGLVAERHAQAPHGGVEAVLEIDKCSFRPEALAGYLLAPAARTDAFVARARHRGILLNSAESFAVGHETDVQAVRIALGPPATRSALEEGLSEIAKMLKRVPEAYELVV